MERLRHWWFVLSGSFWFIPGLVVIAATLLALVAIEIDQRFIASEFREAWPRLLGAGAEASRQLLAAIATSMITVAGTVFSITLVALSLASSQYSPRVLRNFIRDRTNQAVLGAFVGIFVYCLIVLRSIHDRDNAAFTPSVAALLGLVLGYAGVGILVFFINHIAKSVQASHILAAVHRETAETIDRLFPHALQDPAERVDNGDPHPPADEGRWKILAVKRSGYLQEVDFERLRRLAHRCDSAVRIEHRLGDFVIAGDAIARYRRNGNVESKFEAKILACLAIGQQRTLEQDVAFGLRQLVDVALKGQSTGINDSTTTTMCIDRLTALLAQMAPRRLHYAACTESGVIRVSPCHPDFGELLGEAFDQIRQHARGNVAVLDRLLWAVDTLASHAAERTRRHHLLVQVEHLSAVAGQIGDDAARSRFELAAHRLLKRLRVPAAQR